MAANSNPPASADSQFRSDYFTTLKRAETAEAAVTDLTKELEDARKEKEELFALGEWLMKERDRLTGEINELRRSLELSCNQKNEVPEPPNEADKYDNTSIQPPGDSSIQVTPPARKRTPAGHTSPSSKVRADAHNLHISEQSSATPKKPSHLKPTAPQHPPSEGSRKRSISSTNNEPIDSSSTSTLINDPEGNSKRRKVEPNISEEEKKIDTWPVLPAEIKLVNSYLPFNIPSSFKSNGLVSQLFFSLIYSGIAFHHYIISIPASMSPSPKGIHKFPFYDIVPYTPGLILETLTRSITLETLPRRTFVFPADGRRKYTPSQPGEPGLIFETHSEMVMEDQDGVHPSGLFLPSKDKTKVLPKNPEWRYMGEYVFSLAGKLPLEIYRAQPFCLKKSWAMTVMKMSNIDDHIMIRARIALRKDGLLPADDPKLAEILIADEIRAIREGRRKMTKTDDIMNAFESGEESINIISMKCIDYDHTLMEDLDEKLTIFSATVAQKAKYKKITRVNSRSEIDSQLGGNWIPIKDLWELVPITEKDPEEGMGKEV